MLRTAASLVCILACTGSLRAEYQIIDVSSTMGTGASTPTVILLDTETGRTWRLRVNEKSDVPAEWVPIDRLSVDDSDGAVVDSFETEVSISPETHETSNESAGTSIPILFELDDSAFPRSWLNAPVSITGGDLPQHLHEDASRVIEMAMSKYPRHYLEDQLDHIYCLSQLRFFGRDAGGTASQDTVFVVIYPRDVERAERTFHHEMATLPFRKYDYLFPHDQWVRANPEGFEYIGLDEAFDSKRVSIYWDRSLMRKGFVCEYGQSELYNDFRTIVSAMFQSRPEFWERVEECPRLRAKVRLARDFLQQIEPELGVGVFPDFPENDPDVSAILARAPDDMNADFSSKAYRDRVTSRIHENAHQSERISRLVERLRSTLRSMASADKRQHQAEKENSSDQSDDRAE